MKRHVQILLFFACLVPLFTGAREESMEERKQRITRKYLRERVEVTYSEAAVPEAAVEDEEVLASERFQQPEVDFQRHEQVRAMPPPAPRPLPQTENRNWLLSEDPEADDPYADPFFREDPFAMDEPYADPFMRRSSKEDLEPRTDWRDSAREREALPFGGAQRESHYKPRAEGSPFGQQSGTYGLTEQEVFGTRDPRAPAVEGMWPGIQQPKGQGFSPFGGGDPSRVAPFNSNFDQGRLQSPSSRRTDPALDRSFGMGLPQEPQSRGYVPYKSPYQTQYNQQERRGGYGEPRQEYQRPNTFQQWKAKNPAPFDPTSNDAFINEMMPKTRR